MGEGVAALPMTHYGICETFVLSVATEGYDIGVGGGELVETDLTRAQFNGVGGVVERHHLSLKRLCLEEWVDGNGVEDHPGMQGRESTCGGPQKLCKLYS